MPDFDIDFSKSRVAEVVAYVVQKYGKDNTARIGNVGTMKARSSVKDVARTLGHSTEEIDAYGKLVPEEERGGTGDNVVTVNLCLNPTTVFLEHYGKDLQKFKQAYQYDSKFQQIINIAARIEGLAKSAGISGAGVLISPVSLSRTIPLRSIGKSEKERAESADTEDSSLAGVDIAIADWTIKAVEELGLIKFDFLSLDTLDVIDDAMKLIQKDLGVKIDWSKVREDDLQTFDMLSSGNTYGVFQLTEPWMADFCQKFKPTNVEDISTISALYRPGPKDNGMVDSILEVRRTGKKNHYPIPVVNQILASTDSVLTYQEQILSMAKEVAGYTLSQADLLRRAMGKKDKAVMLAEKQRFIQGAKTVSKVSEKDASDLFGMIEKFSDYCLSYDTQVMTVQYGAMEIGKIVEDQIQCDVFSVDSNGLVYTQSILQWHKRGEKEVFRYDLEDGRFINCTEDHKFMTTEYEMLPIETIFRDEKELFVIDIETTHGE